MLEEHDNVTLSVDIMYINGIPFMMTTSGAIHFSTAEMIINEHITTIMTLLKQIIHTYHKRGLKKLHTSGQTI